MIGILTPLLMVTSPFNPNAMIQEMRNWKSEQDRLTVDEMINNTLMEYEDGCDGSTKQEELLQFPSDGD